jgi:hypothetical protein
MYRLTNTAVVIRLYDMASIPNDTANSDRAAYETWLAEGNTPEGAPAPSAEEIKASLTNAVQSHMDAAASARGYDNILSACSYAAFENAFQAEGQAFLVWRAECWVASYGILASVEAGMRPVPTSEELIAELPDLVLP